MGNLKFDRKQSNQLAMQILSLVSTEFETPMKTIIEQDLNS